MEPGPGFQLPLLARTISSRRFAPEREDSDSNLSAARRRRPLGTLIITFTLGYTVFTEYRAVTPSTDLGTSMSVLLYAAIQALFLGIMGWVGSLMVIRGVDFMKVERGVGVVTFKVDKGVGILTQQREEETTTT